jgi:hypothetical protein
MFVFSFPVGRLKCPLHDYILICLFLFPENLGCKGKTYSTKKQIFFGVVAKVDSIKKYTTVVLTQNWRIVIEWILPPSPLKGEFWVHGAG